MADEFSSKFLFLFIQFYSFIIAIRNKIRVKVCVCVCMWTKQYKHISVQWNFYQSSLHIRSRHQFIRVNFFLINYLLMNKDILFLSMVHLFLYLFRSGKSRCKNKKAKNEQIDQKWWWWLNTFAWSRRSVFNPLIIHRILCLLHGICITQTKKKNETRTTKLHETLRQFFFF